MVQAMQATAMAVAQAPALVTAHVTAQRRHSDGTRNGESEGANGAPDAFRRTSSLSSSSAALSCSTLNRPRLAIRIASASGPATASSKQPSNSAADAVASALSCRSDSSVARSNRNSTIQLAAASARSRSAAALAALTSIATLSARRWRQCAGMATVVDAPTESRTRVKISPLSPRLPSSHTSTPGR